MTKNKHNFLHFITKKMEDRHAIVDLLCQRLLKPDYDAGTLMRDPQIDSLKDMYRETAVDRLVTDEDWEEACQMVYMWQDQENGQELSAYQRTLAKFKRFPTIDRVRASFGDERAEAYKAALETIENEGSASFPDERYSSPWRKFDCDAAVSAVTDVIAPNLNDEQAMSEALATLLGELRARRRERVVMDKATLVNRKKVARSLGIWFPMGKDLDIWRSDPRTSKFMPLLEPLMNEVIKRMRLVRSYLQYIPRRRLSTRACIDLPKNIKRMQVYLRGFSAMDK
jgi:hypothetical protein